MKYSIIQNIHRKHQNVGQDALFKLIIKYKLYNYTDNIICKADSTDPIA